MTRQYKKEVSYAIHRTSHSKLNDTIKLAVQRAISTKITIKRLKCRLLEDTLESDIVPLGIPRQRLHDPKILPMYVGQTSNLITILSAKTDQSESSVIRLMSAFHIMRLIYCA